MADEKGISLPMRMIAGTCGAILVFSPRILSSVPGLDPDRTDVDTFEALVSSALIGLPLLGLTLVYMVEKKEMEALHLVLSATMVPLLLMCIFGMLPVYQ